MKSLVGETMATEEEHVRFAAERALEPSQIGRARRKSLREVHSEQQGKVCDKWLRYLDVYEAVFARFRDQPVRILEIGVQNGGSLEVWAKYFPRATAIVGCDVNPECAKLRYNDERIKLVIGDAGSASAEREIVAHAPEFDIIIDDGSHKSSDIIKCFARYFGHLTNTGLYIVEDLHCSYRQGFQGGLYDPHSSMSFFKRLVDINNSEHWGVARQRAETLEAFSEKYSVRFDESQLASVSSLEFSNSLCVITKNIPGRNTLGPRKVAGHDASILAKLIALDGTLIDESDETANPWIRESTLERESEAAREQLTQIAKLQGEQKSLIDVANAGEKAIAELRTGLEEAEKRAEGQRMKVQELESVIESTRQKLVTQEAATVTVSAERAALTNGLSIAREALAAAQHFSEELSTKLVESEDWIFRLSAERVAYERRLAEHADREKLLAASNAAMQFRLNEHERVLETSRLRLTAEELALEQANMARKSVEWRLSERFDEIATLTQRLHEKENEVAAARAEAGAIVAMRKQLAEKDAAIVQARNASQKAEAQLARRFDEIAALTLALRERDSALRESESALRDKEGALREKDDALRDKDGVLREKTGEIAAAREKVARLEPQLMAATRAAQDEKKESASQLSERFAEITRLTRIVNDVEASAKKAESQRDWLREIASILHGGSSSLKGKLFACLPAAWRRAQQMEQLKRSRLFDAEAYFAGNPDVAKSAQDPLRHYLRHGLLEDRSLNISSKEEAK